MEICKRKYTTAFENLTNVYYPNSKLPLVVSNHRKPLIVGIGGGIKSGKTTFWRDICKKLDAKCVASLSLNLFHKEYLSQKEVADNGKIQYDYDFPTSFDFDLLYENLLRLKNGKSVTFPKYIRSGAEVVIVEGMLVLCNQKIRDLMDYKVNIIFC
uniref:Phosphoribulokinase/uridine kinase domain-containing protein n=1 Tax=Panagrolaimus sp. ES5 TaxID=591445 RepID=A0AC34GJT7_9BILA